MKYQEMEAERSTICFRFGRVFLWSIKATMSMWQ